eukprot:jgi/Botrbrau1/21230/Bobra.39_2s0029.1
MDIEYSQAGDKRMTMKHFQLTQYRNHKVLCETTNATCLSTRSLENSHQSERILRP